MSKKKQDAAIAVPTKQFFVSMLTRDISLADAILDLVDNCLDGALRVADGGEVDYSQRYVKITLDEEFFSIEDNCGGIPRDVAKNYAFKMGREPDDDRDSDSETIGMYGVGMKRAIFKMGRDARVRTLYEDDSFEVRITSDWLDNKDWDPLPITNIGRDSRLPAPGTEIRVGRLYSGVSKHFRNVAFVNELRASLAEHFTMFLQRGLSISVNGKSVDPVRVEVLVSELDDEPAPYVFERTIDDVVVSITVGLNTGRGLSSDDDETPEFERDRSASTAGWTVFCNDRAVIVGDKSRLTGWGDGIPLYHYQFSIITGIVEFRSKFAEKLPITTTKRALDTSSDTWLQALVKMKEGMRVWITYTNNWKNHPRADQTQLWANAKPQALRKAIKMVAKREGATKGDGSVEFNPQKRGNVPTPPTQRPSSRRIVFSRPSEEIKVVSKSLFDTFDTKPGSSAIDASRFCFKNQESKKRPAMSSGSRIAYKLRPNKGADRELFLSFLGRLAATLNLESYSYVGLGGAFLEDFRLVHARLGIENMTSIEAEGDVHLRQKFNRPIEAINCVHSTLENYIDSTEFDEPVIVWFDYTDPRNLTDQIERFSRTISDVPINSILRITLNANPSSLGAPSPEEISVGVGQLSGNSGQKKTLQEWRLDRFRERLGSIFPADLDADGMFQKTFGRSVLRALHLAVEKEVLSLPNRKVVWALATQYADGQQMVTATLLICDQCDVRLENIVREWEYHSNPETPHILDIPALSTLERLTMEGSDDAKALLGFPLPKTEMGEDPFLSFKRFYRVFPHFSRVEL